LTDWKVLAIHYGTAVRPVGELGLEAGDPHDAPGRIEYFVWLIRHGERLILVDTGFSPQEAERRGRTMLIHPVEALRQLGISASSITDVVITHLHYDHAGNLADFPEALFHLQDREMAYGTGRCMCHDRLRRPFAVDAVVDAVRLTFSGRVCFHDGNGEIMEGLTIHLVGGHSRGLQVVRLDDGNDVVVIASDALHFQRYLEHDDVFPLFADYADVLEGYRTLRELSGPSGVLVPGHDPAVLTSFPSLSPDLAFAKVLR
jgi:glyoxylase-like metal-dependent hydrolase (beta-lactamase superfamily II)